MGNHNGVARTGINLQKEVSRLKDELDEARRSMLAMTGPQAEGLLLSYFSAMGLRSGEYEAGPRARALRWLRGIAADVLRLAQVAPTHLSDRALCPLCKASPRGPHALGFTFPEGLERHLLGIYNAHQCPVVRAALELAVEYGESLEARASKR